MRNTTRQTRQNRTITVDFHNEATYFRLLNDGKAFLEMIGNCFSHAVTKRISFAPRPGALTTFGKPEATGKSRRALR
jgi:hypothetical protein